MAKRSWPGSVGYLVPLILTAVTSGGCAFGPKALECSHGKYNEAVKQVAEEQLLLNIVRERYNDNPERLDVTAIAAQYELAGALEAQPFFNSQAAGFEGPPPYKAFTSILPFARTAASNRPTISLTPLDDPETLRGLFTPANLDSIILLAETSYPVETVFRLWLEYLNSLPNAVTASGPPRGVVPQFRDFQRAMRLLQVLQDRGDIRFLREEKITRMGGPMPQGSVTPAHLVEAAKNGFEYVQELDQTWSLIRRDRRLELRINPQAVGSPEMLEVCALLQLKPGLLGYEIVIGGPERVFPPTRPAEGSTTLDLFPRSILQVTFYMAHGVIVPPEHVLEGLVLPTLEPDSQPFDWQQVTEGLFTVHHVKQKCRPKQASVAVKYRDHWYYIDDRDQQSKITFSLVLAMTRVNLLGVRKGGPVLTLPVGR